MIDLETAAGRVLEILDDHSFEWNDLLSAVADLRAAGAE